MKRAALASVIAMSASLLASPAANASGWILIDPAFGGGPVVRPPVRPVTPGTRPGVTVPSPGRRPVLQGSVSYGLHLKDETVKVEISDQVAKTYISQTFLNDTDRNLAGTYLFPLPDDTTFSSFSLFIDGRPVEGKILEANAARAEYEAIVRQQIDPGLLEYADYKTVRARIFPIPAHGTKKVELEYTQLLKADSGMIKYRFPLKAKGGDEPIDQMKIDVKLASKQPIHTIWSPTHTISSTRSGVNEARISFIEKDSQPDKDFLLYYNVSDKELSANVLTHRKTGEDGYFLLTLSPPVQVKTTQSKDIVIVADTSGSMQGEKMEQNKKALKYIVRALSEQDRFGLVQFNTDAEAFKPRLLPATAENKKLAEAYIDELEARGGTNIGEAISTAATVLSDDSTRPAYMVLITDGEPTVGVTDVSELLKSVKARRDVRIFDFGVGYDVNTRLLNKLAEEHHGTSQYVEPDENLETALSAFYEKIKSPVLSDVKIAYEGIEVKDIYPKSVKDVFAGSQVLLLGRYKGQGTAGVKLTGRLNGVAKAYSFPLAFSGQEAGHSYLPRIWAMRRIGYLTEVARENGNNKEVVDEIIALSKKYGIISQYTSYLVTDPAETESLRRSRMSAAGLPPRINFAAPAGARPVRSAVVRQAASHSSSASFFNQPRRMAAMPQARMDLALPVAMGGAGFAEADSIYGDEGRSSSAPHMVAAKSIRGGAGGAVSGAAAGAGRGGARFNFAPADYRLESGKEAVKIAKTLNELKDSASAKNQNFLANAMKTVEDKTFYLVDGVWTESTYSEGNKNGAKQIVFGSSEYFDLVKSKPGISKFLSIGRQVIIEFNGTWYKIVQPASATG